MLAVTSYLNPQTDHEWWTAGCNYGQVPTTFCVLLYSASGLSSCFFFLQLLGVSPPAQPFSCCTRWQWPHYLLHLGHQGAFLWHGIARTCWPRGTNFDGGYYRGRHKSVSTATKQHKNSNRNMIAFIACLLLLWWLLLLWSLVSLWVGRGWRLIWKGSG